MINKVYNKIISGFLNNYKHELDEDILLVFRGFNEVFYKVLSERLIHLSGTNKYEYFDIHNPKLKGKKLLRALMSIEGLSWCYYEELIDISSTITDISALELKLIVINNNLFENYYPVPISISKDEVNKLYKNEQINEPESPLYSYYSDCKVVGQHLLFSYINKHYNIDIGKTIKEIDFFNISAKEIQKKNIVFETININKLTQLRCDLQEGYIENIEYLINGIRPEHKRVIQAIIKFGSFFNVTVNIQKHEKYSQFNNGNKYLSLLQKYWGKDASFRTNQFYKDPDLSKETIDISQGNIIENVIKQCKSNYSDLIVTAPTGAGKSLLFQIPALYLAEEYNSVTLVICPLVALMIDQVKELNGRGVSCATYINSAISYEERKARLEGISNGIYSILYLSPELLLASDMDSILGNRKLGLIVIDEAHLVTSWGRDFRVDYWFLGDYLEKLRHGSYYYKKDPRNVPVLCLTATAVYGGDDDVITELTNSLQITCEPEQIYIGYVRRQNITFDIRQPKLKGKSTKELDTVATIEEIKKSIDNNEKTIIYFPFRSSIEDVYLRLNDKYRHLSKKVVKYYSGNMDSLEKDEAYRRFKNNDAVVMLATKAFGMGVNISDIKKVYHFAPTGTLADYVQEIGRAARKLPKGYATTDYFSGDMGYARTLWGLSGLKHYQLQQMIKKLYELYEAKKSRNILFSPETFNYMFDEKQIDLKVKSGLMLLSTDFLHDKFHFKLITVKSRSVYTKQFIIVPYIIEKKFMSKYERYCTKMTDVYPRIQKNIKASDTITRKTGDIYEIDLGKIWETEFKDITFPTFKWKFFTGKLFAYGDNKILPNMKLVITYENSFNEAFNNLEYLAEAIQKTFNHIKRKIGGKDFYFEGREGFKEIFTTYYEKTVRTEYILMLLDVFCYEGVDVGNIPSARWKFIARKKKDNEKINSPYVYCIRTNKYAHIKSNLRRYMNQLIPNQNNQYITYLTIPNYTEDAICEYQLLASLMQLFDIATYELVGGRNPEIFVRINDPMKLKRLASSDKPYKNSILYDIDKRHKRAVDLMNHFLSKKLTNDERWNIIEHYFLGHDTVVDDLLEIGVNVRKSGIK